MTSTHDISSQFSSPGVSLTKDEAEQLAKGESVALDNLSLAETPGITGGAKKILIAELLS